MVSKILMGVAIFFATIGGLLMADALLSGNNENVIFSVITLLGAICISISAWSVANSEKAIEEIQSMNSGDRK